jgi:hypothetical protein
MLAALAVLPVFYPLYLGLFLTILTSLKAVLSATSPTALVRGVVA